MNNFKEINFQILNLYPKINLSEKKLVVVKTHDGFSFVIFLFTVCSLPLCKRKAFLLAIQNFSPFICVVLLDVQISGPKTKG